MNGLRLAPLCGLVLGLAACPTAFAQTSPLSVSLQAEGQAEQAYAWTIDKQVTPTSVDRFIGETQQLGFRLVLTKGDAQARYRVSGQATISNTAGSATTIETIALEYGGASVANTCATGSVAAGATVTCPIEFETASGLAQPLTLTVGTSGGEANASTEVSFGAPVVAYDSVTVTDPSLSGPLTFSASGTHE